MKRVIMYILIGLLITTVGIETVFIINQHNSINQQNNTIDSQKKTIDSQKKTIDNQKDNTDTMNEKEHMKLAEKVIIQTYKEVEKAALIPTDNPEKYTSEDFEIMAICDNLEIISNSYAGNDTDIKNMLTTVQDYINSIMSERGLMSGNNVKTHGTDIVQAKKSLNTCISKYALFDKIGLDK